MEKHHKIAHLGMREFKCLQCPEQFAHNRTLKAHVVRHHSEKLQREEIPDPILSPVETSPIDLVGRLTGEAYAAQDRHLSCIEPDCHLTFGREYDLIRHIESAHFHLTAFTIALPQIMT